MIAEKEEFKLTDKQREAIGIIGSPALYILLYGGSRSAKTFTIVRSIIWRALAAPKSRHAILRFRFAHLKNSIIYDTFPKVMDLCFPNCPHKLDKQDWFVRFPNGSEIWFGGLDDKERTEKILGNEYSSVFLNEVSQIQYRTVLLVKTRLAQVCKYERNGELRDLRLKMFFDENPPAKGHWTYKLFVEKKDPVTGDNLKKPDEYASLLMNPVDNLQNLSDQYLDILEEMPKLQRDRFYLGKFADDNDNPLWTSEIIDSNRVNDVPQLIRIVVAVDPSGAKDNLDEKKDPIGIVVAGLGIDGNAYLLEDLTLLSGPASWGKTATEAYHRHSADRVVGEDNFGGAMVEFVIKAADSNVPYKNVRASRGKVVRAEPIAALTEQGKVKFAGRFDELEDELLEFTQEKYMGKKSPNRADAFVWAMTDLFPGVVRQEKSNGGPLYIPRAKRF